MLYNIMAKFNMNVRRDIGIKRLMEWYSNGTRRTRKITASDYNFLATIWTCNLIAYGTRIQKRLNKIRQVYINSKQ